VGRRCGRDGPGVNIAVASGKGGTGKTTVATNLAWVLARSGVAARYLDCDVEEPNGHLFLKPVIEHTEETGIPVPLIDEGACTACGECVRACEYRALVRLGTKMMLFAELCHGCGGCTLACPVKAITERQRPIGVVQRGKSGQVLFVHGRLNVGEAMSPPLIRAVLAHAGDGAVNIIDSPPGTSCPVITSVRPADLVVLVTEPTPFGLNDLGLALDMVRELGLTHAVVINRADRATDIARAFCAKRRVEIIGELPDDRRIAEAYSRGEMVCGALPEYTGVFAGMWRAVEERLGRARPPVCVAGNAGAP
jgi:MinD superfamily P-loop ATPase